VKTVVRHCVRTCGNRTIIYLPVVARPIFEAATNSMTESVTNEGL